MSVLTFTDGGVPVIAFSEFRTLRNVDRCFFSLKNSPVTLTLVQNLPSCRVSNFHIPTKSAHALANHNIDMQYCTACTIRERATFSNMPHSKTFRRSTWCSMQHSTPCNIRQQATFSNMQHSKTFRRNT